MRRDKVRARTVSSTGGISFAETAFWSDINDSEVLAAVGFPAVVSDAAHQVLPLAKHRTSRSGGYGAVREFSEFLLSSGMVETKAHR
jgi:3-deoxy-D-manno-octulosonate 8-phosphate phosphatase KdsC-like HAD superfamily phosphatase